MPLPKITLNHKPINAIRLILIVIIVILLASNISLGVKYVKSQKELKETKSTLETQVMNRKVLDFSKLFIEKVLKAEEEINFEDRLKLENAVRNLNDEEILAQWNKFLASKDELEAQREVKNLLELLINKIRTP